MDGTVKCPAGHVLKVKSASRGKQAACPACGAKFVVPLEDASNGEQPSAQQQPAVAAAPVAPAVKSPATAATTAATALPAPTIAAPAWHVADPTGQQLGPIPAEAVEQLLLEGRLTADWLVWQQGWAAWRPAAEVFAGRFAPARPQPAAVVVPPMPPVTQSSPTIATVSPASPTQAAPVIVAADSESPRSSTRTRVARRRSKDGPLIALCVVLVIALIVLVPLVIWAVMRG